MPVQVVFNEGPFRKIGRSTWGLLCVFFIGLSVCGTPLNSLAAHLECEISVPESIQQKMDRLREIAGQDSRVADRVAAFDNLIEVLEHLPLPDFRTSLAATEIPVDYVEHIQKHSLGFVSVENLLRMPIYTRGYSLGLAARHRQYEMITERMGLTPWSTAYPQFKIDWKKNPNHTHDFMDRVTSQGKPVVFFLPRQVITHLRANITKAEFQWLMERPERMRNVLFVVGAYDLVTPDIEALREQAGLSKDQFTVLFMRALGAKSSTWDNALF